MRLNIFKKPASKASLDSPFNFLSEQSDLWIESEQKEEETVANQNFLVSLASNQGKNGQQSKENAKKVDFAILKFEFGKIEELIKKHTAQIKIAEEAKKAQNMQIDEGEIVQDETELPLSLKDLAILIFSEKYQETIDAWQKQFGSTCEEKPLSYENFMKECPL